MEARARFHLVADPDRAGIKGEAQPVRMQHWRRQAGGEVEPGIEIERVSHEVADPIAIRVLMEIGVMGEIVLHQPGGGRVNIFINHDSRVALPGGSSEAGLAAEPVGSVG